MKNDIDSYGKRVRNILGQATIKMDQLSVKSDFHLFQTSNGNLFFFCYNFQGESADYKFFLSTGYPNIKIDGKTNEGQPIEAMAQILRDKSEPSVPFSCIIQTKFVTIGELPSSLEQKSVSFYLTNFIFYDKNITYDFQITGNRISLKPIEDYENAEVQIKSQLQVDITAIAQINFGCSNTLDINQLKELMDNLCDLLTLAMGCNINWISYDICEEDQIIFSSLDNRIVKPYSHYQIIGNKHSEQLVTFINETYEKYCLKKEEFDLHKTISAYNDARTEVDFLEARAVKAVVTMEYIVTCYYQIKTSRNESLDNIITLNKRQNKNIRHVIKKALQNCLPNICTEQLEEMCKKIPELNRYTFNYIINSLCKYLNLDMADDDIDEFVKIRNTLIHNYQFCTKGDVAFKQYVTAINFVAKIILGILEYKHEFLDWTKYRMDGWNTEDTLITQLQYKNITN
jgi:hypothetical protein